MHAETFNVRNLGDPGQGLFIGNFYKKRKI